MASGHAEGKLTTADEFAASVPDGITIALSGSGGGLIEADAIHAALERRFLATGHPRDLTLIHALGIGDAKERGLNRFAHEGMVARVIGGHWAWSPRMQALARGRQDRGLRAAGRRRSCSCSARSAPAARA